MTNREKLEAKRNVLINGLEKEQDPKVLTNVLSAVDRILDMLKADEYGNKKAL